MNAKMPNRKSQRSKKMPKKCPSIGSKQSEVRHSELSQNELKMGGVLLTPDREALVDCIDAALIDGALDPRCFNSSQVHMEEISMSIPQNQDRMSSGK